MSSSENSELLGICDRILVMSRGRVVADVDAKTATEAQIVDLAAEAD